MGSSAKPFRVLFLCTGNSARSQIAEKLLNQKGQGKVVAESAGSRPAPKVNPLAIEALERHGYRWTGGRPKSVDEMLEMRWDLVITVCDRAREACPIFPGKPLMAHWGMPDPAELQGSENEKRQAFDRTVLEIGRRLDLFLALPLEQLSGPALESKTREIGESGH